MYSSYIKVSLKLDREKCLTLGLHLLLSSYMGRVFTNSFCFKLSIWNSVLPNFLQLVNQSIAVDTQAGEEEAEGHTWLIQEYTV